MNVIEIVKALRQYRIRFGTEAFMHADVARVLNQLDQLHVCEEPLSAADRIDFYLPDTHCGIECKVAGGPSEVLAQLLRYANSPSIEHLILVTSRRTHQFEQTTLAGKPFAVVYCGAGGI